jgi:hypothetical protein
MLLTGLGLPWLLRERAISCTKYGEPEILFGGPFSVKRCRIRNLHSTFMIDCVESS